MTKAKASRKGGPAFSRGKSTVDIQNILLRDFRTCGGVAYILPENVHRVQKVVFSGAPFEITHRVMSAIAIQVINLGEPIRVRNEGASDQAMNVKIGVPATTAKRDAGIPVRLSEGHQSPLPSAGACPHRPDVAHLIST